MLHGAARLEEGLEPTELEARFMAPFEDMLSAQELSDFGRAYTEEAGTRAWLLPDRIAGRPLEQGFTLEDFTAALCEPDEDLLAQPNVNVVDLDAPETKGAAEDAGAAGAANDSSTSTGSW